MILVLAWPRSPSKHEVVAGKQRPLQRRDHRVLEADDPGEQLHRHAAAE